MLSSNIRAVFKLYWLIVPINSSFCWNSIVKNNWTLWNCPMGANRANISQCLPLCAHAWHESTDEGVREGEEKYSVIYLVYICGFGRRVIFDPKIWIKFSSSMLFTIWKSQFRTSIENNHFSRFIGFWISANLIILHFHYMWRRSIINHNFMFNYLKQDNLLPKTMTTNKYWTIADDVT